MSDDFPSAHTASDPKGSPGDFSSHTASAPAAPSSPATDLWQWIYASGATVPFSEADLAGLVQAARQRNAARGLTGCLVYYEGSFLHAMEGPAVAVEALWESLQADRRHARLLILERRPLTAREFPDWPLELITMQPDTCQFPPLPSPQFQRLLQDFCDGKWRRAFACHRRENTALPICNPMVAAWMGLPAGAQADLTNIQVAANHINAAQSNGETR
jgi:hypothetical protein